MKLTTINFRGIKNAVIELSRITLITGANYQGKSSIIQALQAALCTVLPFDGLKKNQAKLIVNSSEKDSLVLFETDTGEQSVKYPTCESQSTGIPVNISEYAAGLKSFPLIPLKDRAKELQKILKTDPNFHSFSEAMDPILPDEAAKKLWDTIQTLGWDVAYEQVKTKGATLKGEWCAITGERAWGSDKSGNWFPAEWEADLQRKTVADLQKEFDENRNWYEVALSDQAVSQSEIDTLKKQCENIEALRTTNKTLQQSIADNRKKISHVETAIREMDKPDPDTCECPNCKARLQYDNGVLRLPEILTDKEKADRKKAMESAQIQLFDIKEKIKTDEELLLKNRTALEIAEQAELKLKKMGTRKAGKSTPEAVAKTRADMERSRVRLEARKKYESAIACNEKIKKNIEIIAQLEPNGLRKQSVAEAITRLHEEMKKYSDLAKWADVIIDDDMNIYMHGTPYSLLSKSEKFRCRALLQVVFALMSGDKIVIIDDVDELDADSRAGFIGMCLKSGLRVVLGMAESKLDRLPKSNDWLSVYVVKGGEVVA